MHFLPANGLCFAVLLVLATTVALALPKLPWRSPAWPSGATFVEFIALIVLALLVLAGAAVYWHRRRAARSITLTLR